MRAWHWVECKGYIENGVRYPCPERAKALVSGCVDTREGRVSQTPIAWFNPEICPGCARRYVGVPEADIEGLVREAEPCELVMVDDEGLEEEDDAVEILRGWLKRPRSTPKRGAALQADAPLIINLRFQRARSLALSPYPHRVGTGRMAPSAIIRCTNSRAARICASAWA